MNGLETAVVSLADALQLVFEAASVLVVAFGGAAFLAMLFKQAGAERTAVARRVFGRYLIIALELQLAADIISTATDPTLQEIGKLAAIAVIRTFLNYFLVQELRQEEARI
ncbi:DUF1622 domain-containing protein [Lutimaribacter marinistellae]|uniref:DUF1622 domain-containing protein n=1 Tax=Lutimaribacter marinistellae TaxID=1820329 RepID=A0ABV7TJM2_9RHOB